MTKLKLITGDVYTDLSPGEVRTYLQGGSKAGTIPGFTDAQGTERVLIAIHAIELIYI